MNPLVSVIVIVKNGARFLASALESILNQDYQPLEILVIDGGSSDATADIAKSLDVRYMLQKQSGIAAAYNEGIEAALGEYVAFLSHDDIWVQGKLTRQVSYLRSHPEVDYTIGHAKLFLEEGCPLPARFRPEFLQGDYLHYGMETLVARKQLFQRIGGLDPAIGTANDLDWYVRARDLNVPGAHLNEVLLLKRIHDSNTSINEKKVTREFLQVIRRSLRRRKQHDSRTAR